MRPVIGIVDSGPGAAETARAVAGWLPVAEWLPGGRLCPAAAPGPWGAQPVAAVRRQALRMADALVDGGATVLVVACPVASAACLADARERYDVPVVGSVRPAVRAAVARTVTGRIGVLTTPTAVASGAYSDAFAAVPNVEVTCVSWSSGAPDGSPDGLPGAVAALGRARVDTVVLDRLPAPRVTAPLGPRVRLVSGARETARDLARVLAGDLPAPGRPARAVPA